MATFKNAPIARSEALAPLSRDHYTGLVQARHLIKAARRDAVARRKAVAEFIDAFKNDIAVHFDDEERLLAGVLSEEDRDRLVTEHRRLNALADEARALRRDVDPDPARLTEIGEALEEHIRWEERELFNRLQQTITPAQLDHLAAQTAAIEAARPRNIHLAPNERNSPRGAAPADRS